MLATGVPIFKSLVWLDLEKSWCRQESNPGSAAGDTLTARPTRLLFQQSSVIYHNGFSGAYSVHPTVSAEDFLTFAFQHCHRASKKNKRFILIYLIPVKMLLVSCCPVKCLWILEATFACVVNLLVWCVQLSLTCDVCALGFCEVE